MRIFASTVSIIITLFFQVARILKEGIFTKAYTTMFDADGNQAGEPYSIQWSSTMQIGRSSPDGTFQYLGGSIGSGHVKIP